MATFTHDDEVSCLEDVRYLLSLLPSHHGEAPPWFEPDDDPSRRCDRLLDLVPVDPRLPYDMRDVAAEIVDDHELTELHPDFAPNVICALARIDEAWCIGCALCLKACPVDAIVGAAKRMHVVIDELCTGCELCVPVCPVDCIAMAGASGDRTGWAAWDAARAGQARQRYDRHAARVAPDADPAPDTRSAASPPRLGPNAVIAALATWPSLSAFDVETRSSQALGPAATTRRPISR